MLLLGLRKLATGEAGETTHVTICLINYDRSCTCTPQHALVHMLQEFLPISIENLVALIIEGQLSCM